jgi:LPXTG-motif cell wall-anchored protein
MASGGDRRRAIADFDEAIRLDPKLRYAWINRANAEFGINWRQSLDDFHHVGMHPERTVAAVAGVIVLVGAAAYALRRRRRHMSPIA